MRPYRLLDVLLSQVPAEALSAKPPRLVAPVALVAAENESSPLHASLPAEPVIANTSIGPYPGPSLSTPLTAPPWQIAVPASRLTRIRQEMKVREIMKGLMSVGWGSRYRRACGPCSSRECTSKYE